MFVLACGGSSSDNSTYISQASVTTLTSPCTYSICPCSTNICRIRYDFTTFVTANAVAGTTINGATTTTTITTSIGACAEDSFSIAAPGAGSGGTPIICGTNTGYHMIVDSAPGETECQKVNFRIGGTATTRNWDILVTQYACGDTDLSGWPGCLQYYTATANTIQNFAFPTTGNVVAGTTHLQNQHYDICIRRGVGFCYICYSAGPAFPGAIIAQTAFGLSISPNAAAKSAVSTECTTDFVEIPGAISAAITAIQIKTNVASNAELSRFCGRNLNVATNLATSVTVCTQRTPFRVGVNFDNTEVCTANTADTAIVCEQSIFPGGITGFKLNYYQVAC